MNRYYIKKFYDAKLTVTEVYVYIGLQERHDTATSMSKELAIPLPSVKKAFGSLIKKGFIEVSYIVGTQKFYKVVDLECCEVINTIKAQIEYNRLIQIYNDEILDILISYIASDLRCNQFIFADAIIVLTKFCKAQNVIDKAKYMASCVHNYQFNTVSKKSLTGTEHNYDINELEKTLFGDE